VQDSPTHAELPHTVFGVINRKAARPAWKVLLATPVFERERERERELEIEKDSAITVRGMESQCGVSEGTI